MLERPIRDGLLHSTPIVAGESEFSTIAQEDGIVSMRERTQFANMLDVNHRRTMYSYEDVRAEHLLEPVHGHANRVALGERVKDNIVVIGFYPKDVAGLEENKPPARAKQ